MSNERYKSILRKFRGFQLKTVCVRNINYGNYSESMLVKVMNVFQNCLMLASKVRNVKNGHYSEAIFVKLMKVLQNCLMLPNYLIVPKHSHHCKIMEHIAVFFFHIHVFWAAWLNNLVQPNETNMLFW